MRPADGLRRNGFLRRAGQSLKVIATSSRQQLGNGPRLRSNKSPASRQQQRKDTGVVPMPAKFGSIHSIDFVKM